MAGLASLMGGTTFCVERRLPVRSLLPSVVEIFVAGLANICAHEFCWVRTRIGGGFCVLRRSGFTFLVLRFARRGREGQAG